MKKTAFPLASVLSCAALCASLTQPAFADDAKLLGDLCTLNVLMSMPVRAAKQIRFPIVDLAFSDGCESIDQAHGYGYSAVGDTQVLAGANLPLDQTLGQILGTDCYYGNIPVGLPWQEEEAASKAAKEAGENLAKNGPDGVRLKDRIAAAEKAFVLTYLELVKKQAVKFQSDIHKALQTREDHFSNPPGKIKPVDFTGRSFSRETLREKLQNPFSEKTDRSLPEIRSFYDSAIQAIFNDTFDAWLIDLGR